MSLVPERRQGRPRPCQRRLPAASGHQVADLVGQDVGALVQPLKVALVGQRPDQVVGGAQVQPRLAGEDLRRRAQGVARGHLQEPQRALDRCDERRWRTRAAVGRPAGPGHGGLRSRIDSAPGGGKEGL